MQRLEEAIRRIEAAKESKSLHLDLSGLLLCELPNIQLPDLISLDLSFNRLIEIPLCVKHIPTLIELDLSSNCIYYLSIDDNDFESLQQLNVSHNFINDLPLDPDLPIYNIELNLVGNPILNRIPSTIINRGIESTLAYLTDLKNNLSTSRIFEAKVTFIGGGEVGKTSIIKSLVNRDFNFIEGNEKTTHGIGIYHHDVDLKYPLDKKFFDPDSDEIDIYYENEQIENLDLGDALEYDGHSFAIVPSPQFNDISINDSIQKYIPSYIFGILAVKRFIIPRTNYSLPIEQFTFWSGKHAEQQKNRI